MCRTSLGEVTTQTQATARKRGDAPTGRAGMVGLRLCLRWLSSNAMGNVRCVELKLRPGGCPADDESARTDFSAPWERRLTRGFLIFGWIQACKGARHQGMRSPAGGSDDLL